MISSTDTKLNEFKAPHFMRHFGYIAPFAVALLLSACGPTGEKLEDKRAPEKQSLTDQELVSKLANEMDQGCADGWIAGREPRIFKSEYRRIPSAKKARFALEYADFLAKAGENLSQNTASYVPYSKRAIFAYKWWQSEPTFIKSSKHLQNYWLHESLLDASELYWRAREEHRPANSAEVIGHDTEQNMVCRFMESSDTPGSREGFRKVLTNGEMQ